MLLAQVEPEGLLGPLVPVRVGNGSVCVEDVDVVVTLSDGISDKSTRAGRFSQEGAAMPSELYVACTSYGVASASGQALAEGVVTLDVVVGSRSHPLLVTQLVV